MNKPTKLFGCVCAVIFASSSHALDNAPQYDSDWEWNNQVVIQGVYSFWDSANDSANNRPAFIVELSNNQYCYTNQNDEHLNAHILTMHSTAASGSVVCRKTSDKSIAGKPARQIHRIYSGK